MVKVHVNTAPPGYRVVAETQTVECASLAEARVNARGFVLRGQSCMIEQRRRTGALWSYVEQWTPLKRRRVAVRDIDGVRDLPLD